MQQIQLDPEDAQHIRALQYYQQGVADGLEAAKKLFVQKVLEKRNQNVQPTGSVPSSGSDAVQGGEPTAG